MSLTTTITSVGEMTLDEAERQEEKEALAATVRDDASKEARMIQVDYKFFSNTCKRDDVFRLVELAAKIRQSASI